MITGLVLDFLLFSKHAIFFNYLIFCADILKLGF